MFWVVCPGVNHCWTGQREFRLVRTASSPIYSNPSASRDLALPSADTMGIADSNLPWVST